MSKKPKIYYALNKQGKLLFEASDVLWKNRKDLISADNIGEDPFGNFFEGRFGKLLTDHADALGDAVEGVILGNIKSKREFFQESFKYYNILV